MPLSETQALILLQTKPLIFAKTIALTPYSAGNNAGVCTYYMIDSGTAQRPGSIVGTYKMHGTQRFTMRPNNSFGGTGFQAHHIPVQQSNINVNAINWSLLSLTGTSFMVTTQLTGCSVAIDPVGGSFRVAHLQPNGETGAQLRLRLANAGFVVYGQPDYNPGRGVVFGVRTSGVWAFYGQKQDANHNILKAKKIA
jgi:hypothetical protein